MEHKQKILVVEDVYFNQVLIETLLTDWGYTAILASNTSEALEALKNEMPDIIILDLMLPGTDGFHFLKEKSSMNNTTPVIVVSAKTDTNTFIKAKEYGVAEYITKPYNSIDLKNKLNNYLNQQEQKSCS
ncbi:MAG: response regulator [Bacteroidales bacterium]